MEPFEVEPKHISNLNPGQLTCLLRKLLYLEAGKFNIQQSAVHVPLDINVPDGGEDGRIEWSGGVDNTSFIPNCFTMFQNKAKSMSPAECKKEVIDSSNQLKSQVKKVFDEEGTYILFCNISYNNKQIKLRVDAIREALNEAGRTDHTTARIEFYDSNKIAAWVNNYFPAQVYVYQCNLIALPFGIKTFEEWQSHEEFQVTYIANEKLEAYIHSIKELCKKENSPILRITGLSGLGKTRLALETFRPQDDSNIEENILCSKVVYINGGLSDSGLIQLVGQLRKMKRRGLLIVDDCEPSLHRDLKRELGYEGGDNIGLVTLDYNPEERHPDWMSIQLKQNDCKDIVTGIVKEIFPSLANPVVDRIEEFAQGFAGIAVLLGKQIQDGVGDIGRISDKEIVKRLLWGRGEKDEEIIAILTACSLFKCIEFSTEDYTEHLKFLAKEIADDIREKKFNDICITYRERGILQCRGRFIRVSPIPLAITLAADWWSKIPTRRAIEIINKVAKVGLAEQFCEQMTNLQFSTKVQEITKDLCGEKGPFGDPEVLLSKEGSRLFRALVKVNPQATTDAIWCVLAGKSHNELLEIKDDTRRNLVWSIEMLCWWGNTFSKAARLMFTLAVAENEMWSNNARGQFLQLFHIYLPGTEANLEERLQIIRNALTSQVQEERELAIMALGSALETGSFSRSGRVESQGSRVPQRDYEPTGQEIHDYWITCIALLRDQIISESQHSELAANKFAVRIRGLLRNGMIDEIESSITEIVDIKGHYWPEALNSIRCSLDYDKENMPQDIRVRIEALERMLLPEDLEKRLRLVVSRPDWRDRKDENGEYVSVSSEEAVKLAEELANDSSWYEKISIVLDGEQRQAYAFGRRLGELVPVKLRNEFVEACLSFLGKISEEIGNPDVLGAFLGACEDVELVKSTMDRVINEPKLCRYALYIMRFLEIKEGNLESLEELIQKKQVPISDFRILSYGRALDKISENVVTDFCMKIADHSLEGSNCALDILYMYCYQNTTRFALCEKGFKHILMKKDLLIEKKLAQMVGHNWEVVSRKLLLKEAGDVELAKHLAREIVAMCGSDKVPYNVISYNAKAVLSIVLKEYFAECWPIIGDALLSEQWSLSSNLEKVLGTGHEKEKPDALVTELPEEALFKWCNQNQPKGPAIIAHIMPIFSKDEAGISWHPFARRIIDDFGHIEDVRHQLDLNMFSFASGGSRVPYYEKRIKLLSELSGHSCSEVSSWADNLIKYFEKEKQDAQLRTEEWEWGIH